jgi:hypothetical protein
MTKDKIGIFVPEHHGDIALCTCVLKYKDILWPGKNIIWFCSFAEHKSTYFDMLKFNDGIFEVREWPKFKTMEDFRGCIDPNGQLILNRRDDFDGMQDLHNGYFPAPWCMLPNNNLNSVNYAEIPRMVFGASPSWEWHPYLGFSNEERELAKDFCSNLPYTKTVMLETQIKSAGDARLAEDAILSVMQLCRNKFGKCNFIFASKLDYSHLFNEPGVVSCSQFTVRQTALIHNYCDLFIGVASGISVATSCWGNKPIPRIQLCGSTTDYSIIANGPVTFVDCENRTNEQKKAGLERAVQKNLDKF